MSGERFCPVRAQDGQPHGWYSTQGVPDAECPSCADGNVLSAQRVAATAMLYPAHLAQVHATLGLDALYEWPVARRAVVFIRVDKKIGFRRHNRGHDTRGFDTKAEAVLMLKAHGVHEIADYDYIREIAAHQDLMFNAWESGLYVDGAPQPPMLTFEYNGTAIHDPFSDDIPNVLAPVDAIDYYGDAFWCSAFFQKARLV